MWNNFLKFDLGDCMDVHTMQFGGRWIILVEKLEGWDIKDSASAREFWEMSLFWW